MDGKGKQYYTKGEVAGTIYKGQFKNNLKNGKGTMKYYDGSFYSGEWKDDEYHAKGTLKEIDGQIFKGKWNKGEFIK